MKKLQIEAPEGLTLTAFFNPTTDQTAGNVSGYALTEVSDRLYETIIPDEILGLYWVVIKLGTDAIDGGYSSITTEGVFLISKEIPVTPDVPDVTPSSLTNHGPRRVKTKEMEIEQFDPMRLALLAERSLAQVPTWCDGPSCSGRHQCP